MEATSDEVKFVLLVLSMVGNVIGVLMEHWPVYRHEIEVIDDQR